MNRIHLFEFEDQSWFPNIIREGITDYLQFASNRIDLYKPMIPVIKKGLEMSGSEAIIDICSGGGGGIRKIYEHLRKEDQNIRITLTDKFPNLSTFKRISDDTDGKIDYVDSPVDATDIPETLNGFRTMFVSFHHFKQDDAQQILNDAVKSNATIGIFEATERSFVNFIAMLFTPIVVMLAVPFIKPFKLNRIIFTYLIPAIPLFTMWDGLISVLRTYSIREMKAMTDKINAPHYHWEIRRIKTKKGPNLLYLLGFPDK